MAGKDKHQPGLCLSMGSNENAGEAESVIPDMVRDDPPHRSADCLFSGLFSQIGERFYCKGHFKPLQYRYTEIKWNYKEG